jgi:hypothetical protein
MTLYLAKNRQLYGSFLSLPGHDTSGRPLQKGRWAGVVDTVGGNAMSVDLAVSVYPFILRGVSLLGVDSVEVPMGTRLRTIGSCIYPASFRNARWKN